MPWVLIYLLLKNFFKEYIKNLGVSWFGRCGMLSARERHVMKTDITMSTAWCISSSGCIKHCEYLVKLFLDHYRVIGHLQQSICASVCSLALAVKTKCAARLGNFHVNYPDIHVFLQNSVNVQCRSKLLVNTRTSLSGHVTVSGGFRQCRCPFVSLWCIFDWKGRWQDFITWFMLSIFFN